MVRFVHDGKAIKSVMVLDDGSGMSDADLDQAMTFGARTGRDETLSATGQPAMASPSSDASTLAMRPSDRPGHK